MLTGSVLQSLFAIILLTCFPSEPEVLWDMFKDKICDDLKHVIQTCLWFQNCPVTNEDVYDYGLYLLNKILIKSGKTLDNFPPMPLFELD